jgi:hypothetical protein
MSFLDKLVANSIEKKKRVNVKFTTFGKQFDKESKLLPKLF